MNGERNESGTEKKDSEPLGEGKIDDPSKKAIRQAHKNADELKSFKVVEDPEITGVLASIFGDSKDGNMPNDGLQKVTRDEGKQSETPIFRDKRPDNSEESSSRETEVDPPIPEHVTAHLADMALLETHTLLFVRVIGVLIVDTVHFVLIILECLYCLNVLYAFLEYEWVFTFFAWYHEIFWMVFLVVIFTKSAAVLLVWTFSLHCWTQGLGVMTRTMRGSIWTGRNLKEALFWISSFAFELLTWMLYFAMQDKRPRTKPRAIDLSQESSHFAGEKISLDVNILFVLICVDYFAILIQGVCLAVTAFQVLCMTPSCRRRLFRYFGGDPS